MRLRGLGAPRCFTRSFVVIRDEQISARVDEELAAGLLWPHRSFS
jgi:hypothetical protein